MKLNTMLRGFAFLMACLCILALPEHGFAADQIGTNSVPPAMVQLIANYKNWKKVNKEPVMVYAAFAALCVTHTPEMGKMDDMDPHKDKFINVYVNEPGYLEFISKKEPRFPEGTIIVKEKLATTNSAPELMTVMIKRKAGFDPKNGDWDYFALNGKGSKVLSDGKVQNCQECHEMQKSEDYVFRRELTADIWKAMK